VVIHESLAGVEQAREIAAAWLRQMGLELKPSKTRIAHTLREHDGTVGFDFLGWHVQQYRVGYHRCGTLRLGFKTFVTPSPDAQKRHQRALAEVVRCHRTLPQAALIGKLNRVIVGWANYHSAVVAKRVFGRMSTLLYGKLQRWARRRHPRKNARWVADRYWHRWGGRKWVFMSKDGMVLARHDDTPIVRHELVRGHASPYDGDWVYWARRLGAHPETPKRVATLLKRQAGKCARCGLYFRDGALLEVDHILPRFQGGIDAYFNWQLLHRHCHDQKTAADGASRERSQEVPMTRAERGATGPKPACPKTAEEPDASKGARPVLKAGGGRRLPSPSQHLAAARRDGRLVLLRPPPAGPEAAGRGGGDRAGSATGDRAADRPRPTPGRRPGPALQTVGRGIGEDVACVR
jgi:5-methylcytosine-specific restriction endonuclease McrA